VLLRSQASARRPWQPPSPGIFARSLFKFRGGSNSPPPPPGDGRYDPRARRQQQQQQQPPYPPPPGAYDPRQQQQQQQQGPPALPPDGAYSDEDDDEEDAYGNTMHMPPNYDPYGQQQREGPPAFPNAQQQQQQQQQPPLPPGYGNMEAGAGTRQENGGAYYPPGDPTLPPGDEEEEVYYADDWDQGGGEEEAAAAAAAAMDLSVFDKEYILKGLARLYRKKILPLELASKYGHFHSPPLSPSDFDAPPMILLLGQYSVGKTSFIKYLLGKDFPGSRVGPEPTTDRFTAVLWGNQDKIIPGAALCSQADRPFTGLNPFGNNFLSRMEAAELDAAILRNVTLIDTPGILSGQKQRSRNYDYEAVMKWFAERADLIVVMFDAHKLDISDELKGVMELMIPHLDKIRIVLNKADSISTQQLMRVYGALMWSLGKVMNTPEVSRVYMGSFWEQALHCTEQAELLQQEEMDLLHEIMALPQQAVMRKINEMVKRARSVKVHAYLIHYLRKQLPKIYGKREKQRKLIHRLESEFQAAARRYSLPKGDFPAVEPMRKALTEIKDLSEFPKLDKRLVREMDKVFSEDIPHLLEKARMH
jgi:GTPase SAR1 family protein